MGAEKSIECPRCGFVLTEFDTECPRCARYGPPQPPEPPPPPEAPPAPPAPEAEIPHVIVEEQPARMTAPAWVVVAIGVLVLAGLAFVMFRQQKPPPVAVAPPAVQRSPRAPLPPPPAEATTPAVPAPPSQAPPAAAPTTQPPAAPAQPTSPPVAVAPASPRQPQARPPEQAPSTRPSPQVAMPGTPLAVSARWDTLPVGQPVEKYVCEGTVRNNTGLYVPKAAIALWGKGCTVSVPTGREVSPGVPAFQYMRNPNVILFHEEHTVEGLSPGETRSFRYEVVPDYQAALSGLGPGETPVRDGAENLVAEAQVVGE